MNLQFRVKRNGTVILTWTAPTPGFAGSVSMDVTLTPAASVTRNFVDVPGGAAVYTLEVNSDGATVIGHRSLLVQGVLR